jgi:hypothetical protein
MLYARVFSLFSDEPVVPFRPVVFVPRSVLQKQRKAQTFRTAARRSTLMQLAQRTWRKDFCYADGLDSICPVAALYVQGPFRIPLHELWTE